MGQSGSGSSKDGPTKFCAISGISVRLKVLNTAKPPFHRGRLLIIQAKQKLTGVELEWVEWLQLNPWIFRTYINGTMNFMAKHNVFVETKVISTLEELQKVDDNYRNGVPSPPFRYVIDIEKVL